MGLDVGDKNIGVALSDVMGWTAQGLKVVPRNENLEVDIEILRELVSRYAVCKLVVGLPRNMDGTVGPQGNKVLHFVEEVKKQLELPVELWDERLSTVAAEKILLQADLSRKRRRKVIDKIAAAIILQGYLDANKNTKKMGCNNG